LAACRCMKKEILFHTVFYIKQKDFEEIMKKWNNEKIFLYVFEFVFDFPLFPPFCCLLLTSYFLLLTFFLISRLTSFLAFTYPVSVVKSNG
jgi:hypothetical protein